MVERQKAGAVRLPARGHMPRMRVLVVEDDDDTRRLMEIELGEAGYDVIAALDGQHALRLVKTARPKVLLVDLGLPLISGDEFVRRWRASADVKDVSGVIVRGREESAEVAENRCIGRGIAKAFRIADSRA